MERTLEITAMTFKENGIKSGRVGRGKSTGVELIRWNITDNTVDVYNFALTTLVFDSTL